VTDQSNHFIRTLLKRGERRDQYLYTWQSVSGGNATDAITGATLNPHQSHTVTWDCRDLSGNVVPDGKYRIRAEFTTKHAQGPLTPASHLEFTKGPDEFSLSPADLQYFTDMSLTYRPDLETNTLIGAGSHWKYHDGGVDLHASNWTALAYNDSAWHEGPGKLGYSDNPATTLSYGSDASNKHPCYYFRHEFNVNAIPVSLKARVLRDDGVVVYLNETPVIYSNMAEGPTAYDDEATATVGSGEESTYFEFYLEPELLVFGKNIIAAEVHQADAGSSDLGFDLELMAGPPAIRPSFIRGDADGNGEPEVTDAISLLGYLFLNGSEPGCLSAADANDDDAIDISDCLALLWHLFFQDTPLPEPSPDCGADPTPGLSCENPLQCDG
jgi:hypothetical protein